MNISLFEKIFPIPSFVASRSTGLDISDALIRYAEIKQSGDGFVLGRYGSVAIPEGVIISGEIQDTKKLTQVILDLKKKENLSTVRVSLPEEQTYLFNLKVPRVPFNEIRSHVQSQIYQYIALQPQDVYFDFIIIDETETEYDIQVSAVPVAILDSYLRVFKEAKLSVFSFETEIQATLRAVIEKGDAGILMVVDFGERKTTISIVSGETILFATTLDIGGQGLTKNIEKSFDLSFGDAQDHKKQIGLSRKPEHAKFFPVMLSGIGALRDEIHNNFVDWHSPREDTESVHPRIQKIVLSGENATIPGLSEYLSASLRIKVRVANPWVNINTLTDYVPSLKARDALSYTRALGLALRDVNQ